MRYHCLRLPGKQKQEAVRVLGQEARGQADRKEMGCAEGPPTLAALPGCLLRAPEPRIPAHALLMSRPWLREGRGSMRELPSVSITLAMKEKSHCVIKGLEGDRQILVPEAAQHWESGARPHRCESWIRLYPWCDMRLDLCVPQFPHL